MAFPLEPSQLRAQQRAFCLATSEDDFDSTKRVIRPLTSGLFYESNNSKYFAGYRPSSPPIPVELPEVPSIGTLAVPLTQHKRHSSRITTRNLHVRRKSRMSTTSKVKEQPAQASAREDSLDFPQDSLPTEPLDTVKEQKKQSSIKNPLSKLFVKSDKQKMQRSDSESTISQSSLQATSDSFANTSASVPAIDRFGEYSESEVSVNESLTDEDEYLSDGIETLDHRDASNTCSDEEESLNSAFTDIEAGSMIDGSPNIMYDYSVPGESVLHNEGQTKKNQKQKNVSSIYSKKLSSTTSLPEGNKRGIDTDSLGSEKHTPLLRRRESFSFPKLYDAVSQHQNDKKSKLSMIIQTRHSSSNANPLKFFSYSGADCAEGVRKADVNIFIPPKMSPTLEKLPIVGNMSVFDCIGFILLKISELKDDKGLCEIELSFNPNHWRLELTDEDGELYDSNFGVLDRTRLMSSYNCPKYLALCKIKTEGEIKTNEKQSPLPLEFKQNLELFEERARSSKETENAVLQRTENWDFAAPGGKSIEVKVKNIPSTSKVISFFVASEMLVGDLLDLICRQYQVDSTKFKLSGFQLSPQNKIRDSSLLNGADTRDEGQTIPLHNTQTLSEIHVDYFKMVPIVSNTIRSMLDVKTKRSSFQEAGITPNSSAFIQSGITPPVAQLESKSQDLTGSEVKEGEKFEMRGPRLNVEPSSKITRRPFIPTESSSIANLINGKNTQLPTSLNTFYCKWKVFRKKAPLLYKIEKSLIIDGDYIHLAPTDDTNWKSNFYDNSFSGTSQSGHHHYLHHYNYSKYYNDTMLKTSSFHISQIVKLKSYKDSKSPTHFKIVIKKEGESGGKETVIKKKYDLEAETMPQLDEIFEKVHWALQLYKSSNAA
ncbi:hypothetical protein JCM33374_g5770 [Metschnikowia sp. JCM 33374]|nr:hypothetical protein JCM33374_g5770 [Metschnikowia sp. JCM 33374]